MSTGNAGILPARWGKGQKSGQNARVPNGRFLRGGMPGGKTRREISEAAWAWGRLARTELRENIRPKFGFGLTWVTVATQATR